MSSNPVFVDSSALVKLYADEPGADAVRLIPTLIVSQLARVEVPSALWRKHRMGQLSAADAQILVSAFEEDYFGTEEEPERFIVIAVTPEILEAAASLVGIHGLRAYDAVQFASATAAQSTLVRGLRFGAFDAALCTAAAVEGLELLPA